MNTLGVLIADGSEDFCEILAQMLGNAYQVRTSRDGNETLELVRTFAPEVLVLDLMLPGLDGISLLQRMAVAGGKTKVLATTSFVSDYLTDTMEKLGVGYVMHKPCNMKALAARIIDLTQYLHMPAVSRPDPRVTVSNLLLSLNVPTKLRGYGYLRQAVLMMAKDPRQSITKELYPAVAVSCGGTAAQVERSVRSAIQAAWDNRDEQVWRLYFQAGSDGLIQRPTNAAFITCLADRLGINRRPPTDGMVG